ncbi:MAG: hypothetical protein EPGJADBJ_03506 [Saprospiraceae bacterium]|nr:hypothetical protein [Saprospiraceae bacterium]
MGTNHYRLSNFFWKAGLILLAAITLLFGLKTTPIHFHDAINTDIFDDYGSFVGGLVGAFFSLAGIFLILHTINEQKKEISDRALNEQRQKIESRFFELLKIQREICNEIRLGEKIGKYAIQEMLREIRICQDMVSEQSEKLENPYSEERMLNFTYLAFYYGTVTYERSKKLETFRLSVEDYDQNFVEEIIKFSTENREQYKEQHKFNYNVFGGHQIRLNQYFRHLFHTVTYIDNQPSIVLSYAEKCEYIETLRAQLSPHEQVLLFHNSMSELGKEWEKMHTDNPNKGLITKYNLIKNIFSFHPRYTENYPCAEFDNRPVPECRKALLKIYR